MTPPEEREPTEPASPSFRVVTQAFHTAVPQVIAVLEGAGIPTVALDQPSPDVLLLHVNAKIRIAVPEARLAEAAEVLARWEAREAERIRPVAARADRAVARALLIYVPLAVATVWLFYDVAGDAQLACWVASGILTLGVLWLVLNHGMSPD